ncbi:hypothetical protein SARC_05257 [Sphaeroforma arctica JP610]|uniref:Galactosylgalactosylxylosylprotein 3-beta-glucuronosyltransferase n=1 Tax=Sphaeroforma arctica JP610 TaxID=667725 RepID=A0A0L0G068_9EUKA|nr:hypothetical protein SARC_05257 [Sphaeroforma arctica JP610]KNC82465.1 hypothetical protein SARC_05257 [Sphaeroforma arctica JP610]|eukprot:XP_014156367.1 hypothetical protein SARC_05257 [Sphaeroforma arctica JP610]
MHLQQVVDPNMPTIFVVTPTYTRLTQRADITRFVNTIKHVEKMHWIVIEDSEHPTEAVRELMAESGIPGTQLYTKTPENSEKKDGMERFQYHRGVDQRNLALNKIAAMGDKNAIVYFADDDNTYSLEVFDEMRKTERVSVWPVAFVGGQKYERPIVVDGKVKKWHVSWHPERTYPTDMASFAFHSSLLHTGRVPQFSHEWRQGFLESGFLEQLLDSPEDLEPRGDNCTKILVWHTRTMDVNIKREAKLRAEPFIKV